MASPLVIFAAGIPGTVDERTSAALHRPAAMPPEESFWNAAGACGGLTGLIVPVFASSLHAFAIWSSNLFSWEVLARLAMSTHSAARSTYSSAFPLSVSLAVPL